MSILLSSLKVPSISLATWASSVRDAGEGEHAGTRLAQLGGAGLDVALTASADRERRAPRRQRLGDGLADLAVVAHAGDDRDFAVQTRIHLMPSEALSQGSEFRARD